MSTVLEAIAARAAGCEVLGLSLVTNLAAGLGEPLDHEEVLAAGAAARRPDGRAARAADPADVSRILLDRRGGADRHALRERLPGFGWDRARPGPRAGRPGVAAGDISSPRDLDPALDGVQAIVHLAGQPTEAPWPVIRAGEHRGHFPGVRGGTAARRAARGLRLVQPRRRVHPGRAEAHPADLAAAPGHPVRGEQGLRRGARALLRRPVRDAGRLPAHRHVRRAPAGPARAVDLAVARRLRAAGRRRACARRRCATRWCGASRPTPGALGRSTRATRSATSPWTTPRATPASCPTGTARVGPVGRRRVHHARVRHRRGGGAVVSPQLATVEAWIADEVDPADGRRAAAPARRRRRAPSWPTGSPGR